MNSEDDNEVHSAFPDPFEALFQKREESPVDALRKLLAIPVIHFVPLFDDGFPDRPSGKISLPVDSLNAVSVLVNAKQYHRILRRRLVRSRQKPVRRSAYLHESRHRHACSRRRNRKGQFEEKQGQLSR